MEPGLKGEVLIGAQKLLESVMIRHTDTEMT
jgi:hypothetical protein